MVKISVIVGFIIMFLLMSVLSASLPQYRFQRALLEIEHPDEVRRVLNGVVESLLASESGKTEKRGLDLGLSRGFSGSQAAKHLMGLAAANFAGGPGRRRRDVNNEECEKRGLDLGLSRGFSGSQAAKHLMGLAAANFAGGPGRRRRDVSNQE
ncbi:uncharacterized protein LOC143232275 [Tachypleus tridentatus]|uniref:uncharacterized protein LOC143232275 n=1 Tax=Tachypleus tridentatus TaxID=6853 RepID=UPI003FD4F58F